MCEPGKVGNEIVALYHPALAGRYMELLAPRFPGITILPAVNEAEARDALSSVEILLAQISFPGRILAEAPHLRWIQVMGAGADALLPYVPPGVRLSRFTGSLGKHMAEYAVAHILAIAQRMPEVVRNQASHHWEPLPLTSVRGKRLGVAGVGSVGAEVAMLGAAIGMQVGGWSTREPGNVVLQEWFAAADFADFLAWADFVVLALPVTNQTRHIINEDSLAHLRPGAWLLNISRGALIDEDALIAGLRQGQPAGAVLDVFAQEPLPPGHPFWDMPNVVVTSHQSGSVIPEEVVDLFATNLERHRRDAPLH
jgi:glyoxylate/hydroxypyruvate reductase A